MTDFGRRSALHSSTHEDGGVDEITSALLVGRINYVDRGDAPAWDFQLGDLITDGAWHDMDLSSIIDSGATLVHLNIRVEDDAASSFLQIREKDNIYGYNFTMVRTQVADINYPKDMWIVPNANGVIEYRTSNLVFVQIDILVRGWFV